jgi:hypothetical protein
MAVNVTTIKTVCCRYPPLGDAEACNKRRNKSLQYAP